MNQACIERIVRVSNVSSSKGGTSEFYSVLPSVVGDNEKSSRRWQALSDYLVPEESDQYLPSTSSPSRWYLSASVSSTSVVAGLHGSNEKIWWAEGYQSASGSYARALDDVSLTRDIVYGWEQQNNGRLASVYLVFFMERSIAQRDLAKANELLSTLRLDKVTEFSMVAVLRSTFSARALLPAWSQLLGQVHRRLLEQNKNADRLLAGLKRP